MDASANVLERESAAIDKHVVDLDGVCSVSGGPDVACRVVSMSLQAMTVETATPVDFADAVTLQLPQIGIVEAAVAEVLDRGFRLYFEPAPESKLGLYVGWLGRGDTPNAGLESRRGHERIVPLKRLVSLKRHGMSVSMARIVDLSRSGAAITCATPPKLDERVGLGAFGGLVVRLIDGGAAIRFDRLINEHDFSVLIDLDAPSAVSTLDRVD